MKKKKVAYINIEEDINKEVNTELEALQVNRKINIIDIKPTNINDKILVQITYEQEETDTEILLESSDN